MKHNYMKESHFINFNAQNCCKIVCKCSSKNKQRLRELLRNRLEKQINRTVQRYHNSLIESIKCSNSLFKLYRNVFI